MCGGVSVCALWWLAAQLVAVCEVKPEQREEERRGEHECNMAVCYDTAEQAIGAGRGRQRCGQASGDGHKRHRYLFLWSAGTTEGERGEKSRRGREEGRFVLGGVVPVPLRFSRSLLPPVQTARKG